ncbi:MAG TPA: AAA family ATPase [Candidatus Binatia bacterium]|nr:AAA family ATPase [Candidatus Binatia bacterium]
MYNKYFGLRESPFSVSPDPRFFYTNTLYQEAFATLHYGIEAKKGFIVITGEAGTGKTTLLRKLMRNLEATTHSVFIFNTHLDFTELLQLMLRELGLSCQENERLTMIEELNRYLFEQLKQRHVVSVLIDEAQNLSDEILEGLRLLSNLETDKEKLLQIVLMGQPELEAKLDQPALRQLKQRVALHCRLAPLEDNEVGPYIDFRLRIAGYEGQPLFDADAVQRIALYSGGIPRLINTICDNALLSAYAGSQKEITAGTIKEAAHDLRLEESHALPRQSETKKTKEIVSNSKKNRALFGDRKHAFPKRTATNPIRHQSKHNQTNPIRPQSRSFAWIGMAAWVGLAILGGAGAAIYSQQSKAYLSDLPVNFNNFFGIHQETLDPSRRAQSWEIPAVASRVAPPDSPPSTEEKKREVDSVLEVSKPDPLQEPAPDQKLAAKSDERRPDENRTAPTSQARTQIAKDSVFSRRVIETQIHRAIRDRAISGIEVSLINGTAYLDGRVDTERQRLAAEQAARSVPEVRYVRNRIVVDSPLPDGDQERRRVQVEIYKAIHNRAITGVEVSLVNGIAYLDGRVDTERQRLAAERAARSVPEVRYIRNRILVNSPFATGEREEVRLN